jgi:N-acetylglucosamine kinase
VILFLGVDGGQSSTRAVIGDDGGRVLASGIGGPVDHADAPGGADRLRRALSDAVGAACARLGLDPAETTFEAAFGGFTGGPEGKGSLMEERIRARRFGVSDDSVTALTGALAGEPGIVTVAGTGSICFGRNAAGDTARAGGWGYAFGDEGSAFDLTRRALRAALRFEEGWGPPTALHALLREALDVADIRLVQRRLYATENIRRAVAALAPLVDRAALAGDPVAHGILLDAATDLARITRVVRGRLFQPEDAVAIAAVGGVFRCSVLRAEFAAQLTAPGCDRVIDPLHEPAVGALIEGYRLAGREVRVPAGAGEGA